MKVFISSFFLLASTSLAATSNEHEIAALVDDDECAYDDKTGMRQCAVNAMQMKSQVEIREDDSPKTWDARGKSHKVTFGNNASTGIVLANCYSGVKVAPGEEVEVTLAAPTQVFVLPEGKSLNCSEGCLDCFAFTLQMKGDDGVVASLGFGPEAPQDEGQPAGAGMEVYVGHTSVAKCAEDDCPSGWTKPVLASEASEMLVLVHGGASTSDAPPAASALQASASEDLGAGWFIAAGGRGRPFRRRRWLVAGGIRRPYRPFWHPAHPVARFVANRVCPWCNANGYNTCLFRCYR